MPWGQKVNATVIKPGNRRIKIRSDPRLRFAKNQHLVGGGKSLTLQRASDLDGDLVAGPKRLAETPNSEVIANRRGKLIEYRQSQASGFHSESRTVQVAAG